MLNLFQHLFNEIPNHPDNYRDGMTINYLEILIILFLLQ